MRTSIFGHRIASAVARRLAALGAAGIIAATLAPAALAADGLTITTPYPAVAVSPGSKVSFDLSIKTTTAARVAVSLSGAPSGWTATLQGGGFIVNAVQTDGKTAASATVDVSVPDDAAGKVTLVVTGTAGSETVTLPLELTIQASTGDVTMDADIPSQKGASNATFTFNLTLANNTPQDITFGVAATGPDGWTVTAQIAGTAQAATAVVKAGSTSAVSVTVNPPDAVTAGQYPIAVTASGGSKQIETDLQVEITGSYSMSMSTPNQVLSNHGSAGHSTTQQLTLTNGGTAPITNVTLTATPPTNWKVTFDQPTIASIAANQTVTVNATIIPTTDAIAGDYDLTFNASADQGSTATTDIRFTVETSLEWAIVGAALIVLVFAGLWWVFRRYGRR
ncbi:MAG TPA: NEW3 domain-containing protein [Candidatus Limnocylindrales bacterium]